MGSIANVSFPFEPVEELVSLIGSDEFGPRFYRILDRLIGIDHCTVFACSEHGPRMIVAEAQTEKAARHVRSLAQRYVREAHSDDPVWGRIQSAQPRDCSAFLLSPEDFANKVYQDEFYIKPNIRHELALTGYSNRHRVYAGFYRENGRDKFADDNVEMVKRCGPLILQVLDKHSELMRYRKMVSGSPPSGPIGREELFQKVQQALARNNRFLTPREAEICASIVLGHTVLGISLNLGISVNTVATHRKRAYAKLQISSQNELFARYFSIVEGIRGLH